jgi:signal transduction histidine kinase
MVKNENVNEKPTQTDLNIFIKTTQYLSMISSYQNLWKEIEKIFQTVYKADFFAFLKFDNNANNNPSFSHISKFTPTETANEILNKLRNTIHQVVSDGFLSSMLISVPEEYAIVCCAVLESNRIAGVILIGHKQSQKVDRTVLNLYLSLVGLIGTIRERIITAEQLLEYNKQLENTVKLRTKELVKMNNELELFVETIPDGILVVNPNGQVRLVNKSFNQIARRITENSFNTKTNLLNPTHNQKFLETLKGLFVEIQEKKTNINLKIEADQDFWLEITSVTPRHSSEELPLATIFEVRDISSFIEFDEIRKQFVATVSHELRTPISVIKISIENFKTYKEKLSQEQKDHLIDIVQKNCNSLIKLVEDLLVISRFEGSKIKLKWANFFLHPIIEQVIEQLSPKSGVKNIKFEKDFNSEIMLFGDTQRITQIFRILIDNSIKYSNSDSIIKIRTIDHYDGEYNPRKTDGILVEIQDFGMGIKEKDLKHLFKKFFRSDDVKNIEGTGLGLSIAKEFAKMHIGDIYVKSEFTVGSIFSVFLPRLEKIPKQDIQIGKLKLSEY